MNTCICMIVSLCFSPEPITTLSVDYTSIQNKKLFRKENSLLGLGGL